MSKNLFVGWILLLLLLLDAAADFADFVVGYDVYYYSYSSLQFPSFGDDRLQEGH